MQNLFKTIGAVLKQDDRLWSNDEKPVLLKSELISYLVKNDETLLSLLINNSEIEKRFFKQIGKATIFEKEKFIQLVTMNEFLPSSFTSFENKIGLAKGDKLLSQLDDIALVFPHKDCVLEGGQTKEMYIEKPDDFSEKEFGLSMKNESKKARLDLSQKDCDFYVYDDDYGTDEEKFLVKMVYENLSTFTEKFNEVFLYDLYNNKKDIKIDSFEKCYLYNVKGRNNRDVEHLIIYNF